MSNGQTPAPTRGVPVDLGDGKARYLRYSFKVIRQIREQFGENALTSGLNDGHLAAILKFGLDDQEITIEQIEELVDMQNLKSVMDAMTKAMGYQGAKVDPQAPLPAAAASESGSE